MYSSQLLCHFDGYVSTKSRSSLSIFFFLPFFLPLIVHNLQEGQENSVLERNWISHHISKAPLNYLFSSIFFSLAN